MITENDVKRMATLSKLEIESTEMAYYIKEIEDMLKFSESVNSTLEDSKIKEVQPVNYNNLRADDTLPSAENSQILLNAEEEENGFFMLRKKA